jgi:sugar diacid utilization regulator
MNRDEKNILLARYLGFKEYKQSKIRYKEDVISFLMNHEDLNSNYLLRAGQLEFDTNLNWIAVVVKELRCPNFESTKLDLLREVIFTKTRDLDVGDIFDAVFEYISELLREVERHVNSLSARDILRQSGKDSIEEARAYMVNFYWKLNARQREIKSV